MKTRYEKPKAELISFQAAEELMSGGEDVALGSSPGTGTGTEIPPANGKSGFQFT